MITLFARARHTLRVYFGFAPDPSTPRDAEPVWRWRV